MPKIPKDYDPYNSTEAQKAQIQAENKYYNLEEEIKKLDSSNTNKFHEKMNATKRSEILDIELDIKSKDNNIISTLSNKDIEKELEKLGHKIKYEKGIFGGYQAIMWDEEQGVYYGASEVRKDGQAAGY